MRNALRVSVLGLAVLLLASLTAWAGGQKEQAGKAASSSSKQYTIALIPKLVGVPYFNRAQTGAEQAAKDLGVNLVYTAPTTVDSAAQVSSIEDQIAKGVDAIGVAPNDPAAVTPVMMKAKQAGILTMDWDTPADPNVVDYSIHQIDDKEYGQHVWDLLVKYMGDSGDYAIITGGLSAANLNAWIKYGEAYAKTKYPNLHLVTDPVPTDEKQQVAYQKALDLIKAYPNLKGIIGISTPAPVGAAQAVQEKGLQDKIAVVGTSLPSMSAPYFGDGSLDAVTLWDPAKLGYLTVYIAKMALDGKKPTTGLDVPTVGKIRVAADGKTIYMGPPQDFTKDNYKQFPF